jgi:hypothetical protein
MNKVLFELIKGISYNGYYIYMPIVAILCDKMG